jgi:hypothetical protein
MQVNYSDRKCSCGHSYAEHLAPHPQCQNCDCNQFSYSETLDAGFESLKEDLLAALRNKYHRDTCRNCERTFSLSGFSHDKIDRRSRFRVTCQDCGEVFVEINGYYHTQYDRGDVHTFIEILEN